MSGKAAKITITEKQNTLLQQIIRSATAPQRLVQRARLIVLAFGGMFTGGADAHHDCDHRRTIQERSRSATTVAHRV